MCSTEQVTAAIAIAFITRRRRRINRTQWVILGLHGDILEITVENITEVIANCLCVNMVDSSVPGIL
jgi:hypothetical protein